MIKAEDKDGRTVRIMVIDRGEGNFKTLESGDDVNAIK